MTPTPCMTDGIHAKGNGMTKAWWLVAAMCAAPFTHPPAHAQAAPPATYFAHDGKADVLAGGVRMIPIRTPAGDYRVWTKRTGNNPATKVLLLHGGPGATGEEHLEGDDDAEVADLGLHQASPSPDRQVAWHRAHVGDVGSSPPGPDPVQLAHGALLR